MVLHLTEYQIKQMEADGVHLYLSGVMDWDGNKKRIEVFFENSYEEKKIFNNAEIAVDGDLVESSSSESYHLVQSRVVSVKLITDFPIENLTIHDRLMATGLIHEFKKVFRRDKIRAREILKALGVSEEYAEEILLRNSYILPFV